MLEVWAESRAEIMQQLQAEGQAERLQQKLREGMRSQRSTLSEDGEQDAYGERLDQSSVDFADRLLRHYDAHHEHIDTTLAAAIEGWDFNQMAQTDLTVLRLALTEFLFEHDVPREVTTEMAVRIAKKFGSEESGRFVNGVLAKLFTSHVEVAGQ